MKNRISIICLLAFCFVMNQQAMAIHLTSNATEYNMPKEVVSVKDYLQKSKQVLNQQKTKVKSKFKKKVGKIKAKAKGLGSAGGGFAKLGILLMLSSLIIGLIAWILGISGVGAFLWRLGVLFLIVGFFVWLVGLVF